MSGLTFLSRRCCAFGRFPPHSPQAFAASLFHPRRNRNRSEGTTTIKSIDDLKRRALATIWELRATDNDFAAAIKVHRAARAEKLIAALRRRAHEPSAPAAERLAALEEIARIESQLRDAVEGEACTMADSRALPGSR